MLKEIAANLRPSTDVNAQAQRIRNMSADMEAKADTEQGEESKIKIRLCLSEND